MEIKFGTSGWRDVISDNFTFSNVKLVSQSIADYIKSENVPPACIIGYDPRFLSEEFAKKSASVLAANNIKVLFCRTFTPTPVISYEIISKKLAGGINITASHNPPQYSGIKFSPYWGGPALPETTNKIEQSCKSLVLEQIKEIDFNQAVKQKQIEIINPESKYIARLKELIDFKAIKKSGLKIGVDLFYGTARGYLDKILPPITKKCIVIHNYRDVMFGGRRPEPDAEGMAELKKEVIKNKLNLGVATDGDADRFGILDSDGSYINCNKVIALLLHHLIKTRGWKGLTVRSVMTTGFIDAIAKYFNVEVKETPVGFKFIGQIMTAEETKDKFIIGGEESGGLTIRGHVPEKDGILACLLMAEMAAVERKPIKKIIEEIEKKVGKFIDARINYEVTQETMNNLKVNLKSNIPDKIAGIKVNKVVTIDGFKFILEDNSWVGIRLSGTEPVVRLYMETESAAKIQSLRTDCEKLFKLVQ